MNAHGFQHVAFEGLGSIETWLRDAGARLSTTRFFEETRLPSLDDVDFLVVMGGPMSVHDEAQYPWLAPERRFITAAIERGTPVLGVCLGAQLIAHALGAGVRRNDEREIGWFPIVGTSGNAGELRWAEAGHETRVFHWHGETFDLPPGAEPLAQSAACENQAFRIGDRVLGLQFHLEVTPGSLREMATHGRAELTSSRFVQTEPQLLEGADEACAALRGPMFETLQWLTAAVQAAR